MSKKRKKETMDRLMQVVRAVHPEPFRLSWRWSETVRWGSAVTAAIRQGLIRRVRGAPGCNYYVLNTTLEEPQP